MINKTIVFLAIHAVIIISIFTLRYLKIGSDVVLLVAAAVISLETICLVLFIRLKVNRTARRIKEVEEEVAHLREDTPDVARIHRELLYMGHQIKTIQNVFKTNGNGHHRRVHPPTISHS